jgi:hypothetical protein
VDGFAATSHCRESQSQAFPRALKKALLVKHDA